MSRSCDFRYWVGSWSGWLDWFLVVNLTGLVTKYCSSFNNSAISVRPYCCRFQPVTAVIALDYNTACFQQSIPEPQCKKGSVVTVCSNCKAGALPGPRKGIRIENMMSD